jgi:hypothetical protein
MSSNQNRRILGVGINEIFLWRDQIIKCLLRAQNRAHEESFMG